MLAYGNGAWNKRHTFVSTGGASASISFTVESDGADDPADVGITVIWLSVVAVEAVFASEGAVPDVMLA